MKRANTRVLTVGGGSAGHVAPVVAVIDELAVLVPGIEIRFWCDRGFLRQSEALMKHAKAQAKVEKIFAGKLRRYHGASALSNALDLPTLAWNIFDLFVIGLGFAQSIIKLLTWRPKVVFCKGGFVCLPVGYAAWLLRIPLVIHDSDAHPGLTNRLLAHKASVIATGAPLEHYNYPADKARYVGIPTAAEFRRYSQAEKKRAKKLFHVSENKPLLVVIGGGLGAKRINDATVAVAPQLIERLSVIHISGVRQYDDLKGKIPQSGDYKLHAFLSGHLARLLGAADIVVSRAGASAMAELAAAGASVIMVPNAQLTGGHQLKNARVFTDKDAALALDETLLRAQPEVLLNEVLTLLDQPLRRQELGDNLSEFARPGAAKEMASIIKQML